MPSEAPDRGILLKGTQVSGAGGRGSEEVRVWMRTRSVRHTGGAPPRRRMIEEEQPGRRERGTPRPIRESFRDKQPMRELNAAAGPNSVSIQTY